jgi:stage V sporulation protein B
MKKTVFIKNAAILTASSLILRFAGIIFKVWLAKKIGSEGIGLYQLVFSVYILASTFATSGISTAVTRLVAEELALGTKKSTVRILKRAIQITLIIAFASALIIYFGAELIAKQFLGDMRALDSIKILPLSLPFVGTTACVRGYFIARRKVTPNAVCQIAEQVVRIGLILLFINLFNTKGVAGSCFAVMLGDACAEIISFILLWIQYIVDIKRLKDQNGRAKTPFGIVRKILHIAVPITSGRYLNTLLRTAENILVPKNLAKYPNLSGNALSQFGMIKGMALPILFFPSAILNSVSTLLIPEISEAVARNQKSIVRICTKNIIKFTSLTGFIFGAIFLLCGERIGILIYGDTSVGFLLKALSPIVPLMYLDSISDGILKGLDQQNFTFRTAITDSSLRIILILILLKRIGLWGFIIIMYFSNFLTCFLNVKRLIKVSGVRVEILREIFLPLSSALISVLLCNYILSLFGSLPNLVYIILFGAISCSFYLILLYLLKIIGLETLKTTINRHKNR